MPQDRLLPPQSPQPEVDRHSELQRIVQAAVDHILDRPDSRRGPYLIDDDKLRKQSHAA